MQSFRRDRFGAKAVTRLAVCLVASCLCALPAIGQAPPGPEYPDKPAGLEKLAREILKTESKGDTAQFAALLNGLLLSNSMAWYSSVFDEDTAASLARRYDAERAQYPKALEEFFLRSQQEHFTEVQALRFENSCDDASGEQVFGVLFARDAPVPIYELRLGKGESFRRLWALAYVDGGFRYVGSLRPPERLREVSRNNPPPVRETTRPAGNRLTLSENVAQTRLVHTVRPEFPSVARKEHLQGTVRMHAIIGTDGMLRALQVISGYCSLAESAVKAVRQWRYKPPLVGGTAVEIDTFIEVVFQLSP